MFWSTGKKSKHRYLSIFALVALFLTLLPTSIRALEYQSVSEGLDYAVSKNPGGTLPKIHLLRVDLHHYQIKVLDAREMKSQALSVKEMALRGKALAAINANFFDPDRKPLGLVVEGGKMKNAPKPVSWYAAFLVKNDSAKVAKIYDAKLAQSFDEAVQAGPRLVVAGKSPKLKSETSPKSAVGIDAQGRVVLIATEGSAEINELARWLALSEKKGGAGLSNALNLDGGSSTQFFAKAGSLDLWIPGYSHVPIALGVFKKVEDAKKNYSPSR